MSRRLDVEFTPAEGEGAQLGESPFWDHGDAVWWVDIAGRRLMRTLLSARRTQGWPTPETPGFVVLASPARPFVGMESGIFAFLPSEQRFERVVRFDRPGQRFNDATVDGTGRLWASTMATDASPGLGALHVVTADLALRTMLDGLTTPNGLAADMRRGRLFVSDSHPAVQTIWTMACDVATGDLGARAVFASMTDLPGRPDGAALGEGADSYWIAAVDGGALYGYSGEGQLHWIVPLPFPAPTKAAFVAGGMAVTAKAEGGHDGRLVVAADLPPVLRGPGVAFWKPGVL